MCHLYSKILTVDIINKSIDIRPYSSTCLVNAIVVIISLESDVPCT